MNITTDWIVVDTNVWVFGLRKQPDRPACAEVLKCLHQLQVRIPRQILLELRHNLNSEEMNALFRLWNCHPERIDISWDRAGSELIDKYRKMGCKLGDSVVSAHIEAMEAKVLISENRDFLEEIGGLPFRVLNAEEALREIRKQPDV